jgi:hypothetical protein
MIGFNSNWVNSGKRWIGNAVHKLDSGSHWLGGRITDVKNMWNAGKKNVRLIADSADNTLNTNGALRNVANIGIKNLGSSSIGNLIHSGINETEYINKRLNNSLSSPLLKKFINT